MATAPDADLRRRSPWRVLLPVLLFGLVVLVSSCVRVAADDRQTSGLVLSAGLSLLAIWAVVDGLLRLLGRHTFLGTGRGLDRVFGLAQVAVALGAAVALLPRTWEFLSFVASSVTGGAY